MSARVTYPWLIARLAELEPPIHVFGGFAEDAVLHGRTTRPHGDIDVLVLRPDLDMRLEQFGRLGFRSFETYYEIVAGEPLVLNGQREGVHLEIGVFDCAEDGSISFRVRDRLDRACRIVLPPGTLAAEPVLLDGLPLRAVSPLALYLIRAALGEIGSFGPLRPSDRAAQQQLRQTLLAGIETARLRPDIRPNR